MFVTKISMPYAVHSPPAFATAVAVAVSLAVAVAVAKLVHGKKRRKKSNCILYTVQCTCSLKFRVIQGSK